ncbi:type II secretion system protein GspL [Litoribrevibacter euphylliae]|uniref:Type II secretion system protein L n=1 Tax=Litoribrevibacter euphylliae TaxID=1834034 RepID=A0ABV7HGJ7_9GAMM
MKEKGYLFLPDNFDTFTVEECIDHLNVEFVRWSDLTRSVDQVQSSVSLTEVQEHLSHYPVDQLVVILPPTSVSMMEVTVPTKKTRQLKQALPFIVEEQSAQDPDSLLLVSDYKPEGNQLNVITLDKTLLEKTLSIFRSLNIDVDDVYSVEQLLPTLEQQLLIATDDDMAFVSHPRSKPIYLPIKQLPWVLKKFVAQAETDDSLLNIKLVISESSTHSYADLQEMIEVALPEGQAVDFYSDKIPDLYSYLVSFAGTASNQSSYFQSLLVGSYKPKKQSNQWWNVLAPTLVFGSVVLCCHLALTLYSGWQYQQKANELQSQIYSTVKKAIPNARLEKLQSDRALRSKIKSTLSSGSGSTASAQLNSVTSDIITALVTLSKESKGKAQQPYVQRLSYRAATGETQLELHANSFAQVDNFKEKLVGAGYQVTVGSVTNDGGLFKGRIILAKEG